MSKKASKTEKSIKNKNKVETNRTFSRYYTNFKVITGRKEKKVIAPKFGHYYFFQVYFHAYFFPQKFYWFLPLLCRIYTCHVTWHAAAASKCNFWEKNSNKSVKNQKREKSAKIWNKRFWKTITNSTTNYKLYLR